MKPFCEIIVSSILPALRAIVTKNLMEDYGYSQTKAAQVLGISQPAISQYKKEIRGSGVKVLQSNKEVMKAIKKMSEEIASGNAKPIQLQKRFCEICGTIRKERIICQMHKDVYPGIAPCNLCFK